MSNDIIMTLFHETIIFSIGPCSIYISAILDNHTKVVYRVFPPLVVVGVASPILVAMVTVFYIMKE